MYSFSMIAYQLFELTPPFSGMDPVDAARKAALAEERPPLMRLATNMPTMKVSRCPQQHLPRVCLQVRAGQGGNSRSMHPTPASTGGAASEAALEHSPLLMHSASQAPTTAVIFGQRSVQRRTHGTLLLMCELISKEAELQRSMHCSAWLYEPLR